MKRARLALGIFGAIMALITVPLAFYGLTFYPKPQDWLRDLNDITVSTLWRSAALWPPGYSGGG